MQIEAAGGVHRNVAIQIERIRMVFPEATVGVDIAAEELAAQAVDLGRVLGESDLAVQLRQRRYIFHGQPVVLEAERAFNGDMRLRCTRHGELQG